MELLAYSVATLLERSEVEASNGWLTGLISFLLVLLTEVLSYAYKRFAKERRSRLLRFVMSMSFVWSVLLFFWMSFWVWVAFILFCKFVKEAWKHHKVMPAIPKPKDEKKPPVVIKDEERQKPIEDKPLPIENTVKPPVPEPQPVPVAPIPEQPKPEEKFVAFTVYVGKTMPNMDNSKATVILLE